LGYELTEAEAVDAAKGEEQEEAGDSGNANTADLLRNPRRGRKIGLQKTSPTSSTRKMTDLGSSCYPLCYFF
jgi:hypothetical protein